MSEVVDEKDVDIQGARAVANRANPPRRGLETTGEVEELRGR